MTTINRSQESARKAFAFKSLPTELRLMIWKETFEPRILHIIIERIVVLSGPIQVLSQSPRSGECSKPSDITSSATHLRFKAREGPPIALQICRESRYVARKHYAPSFRPTTIPNLNTHPSEMKQTAIYFNPNLDAVHVVDDGSSQFHYLFLADQETLRSIKTLILVVGSLPRDKLREYFAWHFLMFARIGTLIFVIKGEVEPNEQEFFRENMGRLVKARNSLVSQGDCSHVEWKPPAVEVMSPQTFESQFGL